MARLATSKAHEEPPPEAASLPLPCVLDVGNLARPDLGTIGALCQVALEVRRCEGRLRLDGASAELLELIELAGLTRVLTRVLAPGPRRWPAAERHATEGAISSRASARPGSR